MSRTTPTEPIKPRETAAEIERSAAEWAARADRGPLSAEEMEELARWAAADTRHAGAYARAMAVSIHLDRVAALGDGFSARQDQIEQPVRRRIIKAAAGVAVASATGLSIFAFGRQEGAAVISPIATAKGVIRRVALQEGSQITLNTQTKIRPELTGRIRRIDLIEGEALFDVTKDPDRPFVVYAGDLSVRAVGTSFSIRKTAQDAIRLVVSEGIVEISRKNEVLGQVHAGIEMAVDEVRSPVITTLSPTQLTSSLAWRQGRIDLQGLTLRQAADEFSRYSDLKIRVDDPSVADLHITGIYATNDPAGFAENAALSLGLKSVRKGNEVMISRS